MTPTSDLLDVVKPITAPQMDMALLDMTGDLDTAQVVQNTLPSWLVQSKPQILRPLQHAHADSADALRIDESGICARPMG